MSLKNSDSEAEFPGFYGSEVSYKTDSECKYSTHPCHIPTVACITKFLGDQFCSELPINSYDS